MVFSPKSLILSPMCCNEFLCCARVIQFHSREHLCRHDMPCSSCGSDSLNSMTFVGDGQELFSTLSNDSWASLSSRKHRACSSSSSSCTSPLMSPSSSATAFRLLFQLPWCNLPRCVLLSYSSTNLWCHICHLSLILFLLACLRSWTIVPFQHDSLLFHPCRCSSTSVHSSWDPFRHPIHLWLLLPCARLALQVTMFCRTLLRTFPRHRFLRPCRCH